MPLGDGHAWGIPLFFRPLLPPAAQIRVLAAKGRTAERRWPVASLGLAAPMDGLSAAGFGAPGRAGDSSSGTPNPGAVRRMIRSGSPRWARGHGGPAGRPHGRAPSPSASRARDRQAVPCVPPSPEPRPSGSRSLIIALRPSTAVSESRGGHDVLVSALATASAALGPRASSAACHRRIASRRIIATLAIRFLFGLFPTSRR